MISSRCSTILKLPTTKWNQIVTFASMPNNRFSRVKSASKYQLEIQNFAHFNNLILAEMVTVILKFFPLKKLEESTSGKIWAQVLDWLSRALKSLLITSLKGRICLLHRKYYKVSRQEALK